jgi:hypothetical protein
MVRLRVTLRLAVIRPVWHGMGVCVCVTMVRGRNPRGFGVEGVVGIRTAAVMGEKVTGVT